MRKRRNITTMDTQERYFQNSLGHPSLPTALFFLADPRALIRSISSGIACCSAAFCGRLTSSFLAEAFRPTPVSRERSTAVSPAGPRSEGSSRKRSTAVSPFNPRAKGSSRKRSTAVPATEPGSTSMIAGPVAVIPLACGRLELGLWPCGRLDTMVAGPVAVLSENGIGWGRGRRRR